MLHTDAAPEILKYEAYGISVDVFSFGVMLAEIMCRCSRLPQQYCVQQYNRVPKFSVVNGWRIKFPKQVSETYRLHTMLVEQCWHQIPSKRPTFKDIELHLEVIGNQQSIIAGSPLIVVEGDETEQSKEEGIPVAERVARRVAGELYPAIVAGEAAKFSEEKLIELLRSHLIDEL